VRASSRKSPAKKRKTGQSVRSKSGNGGKGRVSLVVRDRPVSTRPKRRKKGGYPALRGLRWSQVQEVYRLAKLAKEAGWPLNTFFTLKLPEALQGDDRSAKRWLCNRVKHVLQTTRGRNPKRRRQERVPAVTVYEKKIGGHLHAHMLFYKAGGNVAVLDLADGDLIDIRRADDGAIGYITKSRLPGSDEFEATCKHQRQGGQAPIKGKRLSFNGDAEALLAGTAKAAPVAAYVKPAIGSHLYVQPLLPFDSLPQIDVLALAEAKRIRIGLTQDNAAGMFGITQSHWSHSVKRRHDRFSGYVIRSVRNWALAA
jgi:hypothetical protein